MNISVLAFRRHASELIAHGPSELSLIVSCRYDRCLGGIHFVQSDLYIHYVTAVSVALALLHYRIFTKSALQ